MIIAVLGAQDVGLRFGNVVLLLKDFDDKRLDGGSRFGVLVRSAQTASGGSASTKLSFRNISDHIELIANDTNGFRSDMEGASTGRRGKTLTTVSLTFISDKQQIDA